MKKIVGSRWNLFVLILAAGLVLTGLGAAFDAFRDFDYAAFRQTEQSALTELFRVSALKLLLGGGMADAMSKIFEQLGNPALADHFLLYTFLVALILCALLNVFGKKGKVGQWEAFFGLVIGIPNFLSSKFLLRALKDVAAVIAYPVYSVAGILLVTLAGLVFFRERLEKRQWLALGLILTALVLLNL